MIQRQINCSKDANKGQPESHAEQPRRQALPLRRRGPGRRRGGILLLRWRILGGGRRGLLLRNGLRWRSLGRGRPRWRRGCVLLGWRRVLLRRGLLGGSGGIGAKWALRL